MRQNSAVFGKSIMQWQGRWRAVFSHVGLMSLCLALFACDQSNSVTAPSQLSWSQVLWGSMAGIPQSPEQAKQWLAQEVKQVRTTQGQSENSRLSQQLQNLDRRLVRSVGLEQDIAEQVFTNLRDSPKNKGENPLAEQRPTTQQPQSNWYDLGTNNSGVLNQAPQFSEATAETMPDLSQADAKQIQYVGMITTGLERFGLVRVGERVYRVEPNTRIGRGQWRVLQFDATKMQVLINGQTVHYEK